jgi:hypothetical protein
VAGGLTRALMPCESGGLVGWAESDTVVAGAGAVIDVWSTRPSAVGDGFGSDGAGSDGAGSDGAGSDGAGSDRAGSDGAGSDGAGSNRADPASEGREKEGADTTRPVSGGSDRAVSVGNRLTSTGSDRVGLETTRPASEASERTGTGGTELTSNSVTGPGAPGGDGSVGGAGTDCSGSAAGRRDTGRPSPRRGGDAWCGAGGSPAGPAEAWRATDGASITRPRRATRGGGTAPSPDVPCRDGPPSGLSAWGGATRFPMVAGVTVTDRPTVRGDGSAGFGPSGLSWAGEWPDAIGSPVGRDGPPVGRDGPPAGSARRPMLRTVGAGRGDAARRTGGRATAASGLGSGGSGSR